MNVHGILLVNKKAGMTSHDVVQTVRRKLKIRKVGHLGTLDPMAEGVLPLALGRVTRLSSLLIQHDKTYVSTFRLGMETDTHDKEGKILADVPLPESVTPEKIEAVCKSFEGTIYQVPPLISAKKYKGKPLYWWVRKGKEVPPPRPKKVTFYEIRVLSIEIPYVTLEISCSAGAYIRALARDVGKKLGVGAIVYRITRVRWGHYSIDEALPYDDIHPGLELKEPYYIPIEKIEPEWPELYAHRETIEYLMRGQSVRLQPLMRNISPTEAVLKQKYVKVFSPAGRIVGVAKIDYPNAIIPWVNFPQFWNEEAS